MPQSEVPQSEVPQREEPKVEEPQRVEPKVEKRAIEVEPQKEPNRSASRGLKPLLSFSSLLNGGVEQPSQEADESSANSISEADSKEVCDKKLEAARTKILEYISQWRPRFVATFEMMTFSGGVINIAVPTSELEEEILRSQSELLLRIIDIAGVKGTIDLRVELNEQIRASRPIRLEDRVAHIISRNANVEELRKRLDLMIE